MTEAHDGNLAITLATWTFLLSREGILPQDPTLRAAIEALDAGEGEPDALGQALVDAVREAVGGAEATWEQVRAAVAGWYGPERVLCDVGRAADREDRVRGIRRFRFKSPRPWIALILDRFPDGHVGPHWVMVEEFGESIRIMDPYPWDDVDEEYEMPQGDFQVKWELAGLDGLWFA